MSELFLIAHKVRGEPAFDVATRVQIGDEEGWIIPTSGHRAYPIMHWELSGLGVVEDFPSCLDEAGPLASHPDFASAEDHYTVRADPTAPKPTGSALLAALGLGQPKRPTVARRI